MDSTNEDLVDDCGVVYCSLVQEAARTDEESSRNPIVHDSHGRSDISLLQPPIGVGVRVPRTRAARKHRDKIAARHASRGESHEDSDKNTPQHTTHTDQQQNGDATAIARMDVDGFGRPRCCDCSKDSKCCLSKDRQNATKCKCKASGRNCTNCANHLHCRNKASPMPKKQKASNRGSLGNLLAHFPALTPKAQQASKNKNKNKKHGKLITVVETVPNNHPSVTNATEQQPGNPPIAASTSLTRRIPTSCEGSTQMGKTPPTTTQSSHR